MDRSSRLRRVALALAPVALVATYGVVLASYTATTTNPGNKVVTGTVSLSDNDGANMPMYTAALDGELAAGQSVTRCITPYTGTLPAEVWVYRSDPIAGASAFDIYVERDQTPAGDTFPSCAGFTTATDPGDYFGPSPLGNFPTAWGSFAGKSYNSTWNTGNSVAYRFTITARDNTTLNGSTTPVLLGDHTFTWEARNR